MINQPSDADGDSELSDDEEQLVANLAMDFVTRSENGEISSKVDYIASKKELQNKRLQETFLLIVNMHELCRVTQELK